ncbi:thymidylate synthase [Rhodoferax ferrireducens T118]|uniref:thymidylate synthase n=1 Tax=Albidiferax ferrireducens (strain ATCC BAA-621 / DSM 15236 / T118) TaxID=338969 RepID=Q21ZJ9_ALBFT|nr:thymidylate synthase [Rhodoferax ferrireducens]ABD68804.1 thymidylate synthase [Rhodoferax ferrireducens T118]
MFHCFDGVTADEVWRKAIAKLQSDESNSAGSRLGRMRELLHCALCIKDPRQRWVLSRRPAINPAFAIAEVIWILLGSDASNFLNFWNPVLPKYAGSGGTYHGAYGARLRTHFGLDQIERVYQILSANPESRQAVLQIWDSREDLPLSDGASRDLDIPCNLVGMLKVRAQKLEWLQIMRSNDVFLGTPHNLVQFTSLQEIIAGWLGIGIGSFSLVTDSLHLYEHDYDRCSMTKVPSTAISTDSIALSRQDFNRTLPLLEYATNEMRSEFLTPARLIDFVDTLGISEGWANYIYIVAADTARRRSWFDEMHIVANKCSNLALQAAWQAWLARCTEHQATQSHPANGVVA